MYVIKFHGGDIYNHKGLELIDFSSNINPLGVPESFKNALYNGLDEFTKYPDIKYITLRKNIGEYLKIDNIDFIIPGNGAVDIIYRAIEATSCSKVISLSPTFSEYSNAAYKAKIPYEEVCAFYDDYENVNLEEILNNVVENTLVVICNPNNPTGTLISRKKMIFLIKELEKKKSMLIVDEAFMEFTLKSEENSMIHLIEKYNNLIIVRAATKFFGMPGIRLGYGITANKNLINKMWDSMEPWSINTAAVIAGNTVFKDEEYIVRSEKWIEEERGYLYKNLSKLNGIKVYKSSSNFHLIKILREGINGYSLKENLIKSKILIRVPKGFNNLSEFHFRLAVKDRISNDILLDALERELV
ncbi:pyridoxal phosphate-dependent aminotransferase [Clostridium sp. JNZ J1-5]